MDYANCVAALIGYAGGCTEWRNVGYGIDRHKYSVLLWNMHIYASIVKLSNCSASVLGDFDVGKLRLADKMPLLINTTFLFT